MKRLFTLVCLFAMFSMVFASSGSPNQSDKDVKQENMMVTIENQDVQSVAMSVNPAI